MKVVVLAVALSLALVLVTCTAPSSGEFPIQPGTGSGVFGSQPSPLPFDGGFAFDGGFGFDGGVIPGRDAGPRFDAGRIPGRDAGPFLDGRPTDAAALLPDSFPIPP